MFIIGPIAIILPLWLIIWLCTRPSKAQRYCIKAAQLENEATCQLQYNTALRLQRQAKAAKAKKPSFWNDLGRELNEMIG